MIDINKMSSALIDGHMVYWEFDSNSEVVAYDSSGIGIGKFDNVSDLVDFIKAGNYTFLDGE